MIKGSEVIQRGREAERQRGREAERQRSRDAVESPPYGLGIRLVAILVLYFVKLSLKDKRYIRGIQS